MESFKLSFKEPSATKIVESSVRQIAKTPSLIKSSFQASLNVINKSLVQKKHTLFGDLIVVLVIAFVILLLSIVLKKFDVRFSGKRAVYPGKNLVLEGFKKDKSNLDKIIHGVVNTPKTIDEIYYSRK
tara:strand:- start:22 stop:405 length:384 start_codon:yes stop_codon:yes gene_type:complete